MTEAQLQTLVEEMAEVILPFLDIRLMPIIEATKGDTDNSFTDKIEEGWYEIEIGKNQTKDEIITTIAHELVHVAQLERGDVFDFSKPYNEQSHEIEAYKLEARLARMYKGN